MLFPYGFLVFALLPALALSEPGSCPPTLPVDMCEARCGAEGCAGAQLCCPTQCGGAMCVDPMTTRHFVNLVRPGKCPEYPTGAWVCSDTCTGDGDCPRARKCCANRCGARTCQRPDPDDRPEAEGEEGVEGRE